MIRAEFSIFDYLVVSEIDKKWGIYVTGSGSADIPPYTQYPPTQHPKDYMFDWREGRILTEFQILYITRGKGIFETKTIGKKKVSEGCAIFLFPGVWHSYRPNQETGWKEHWVSFNGTIPAKFLENGILSHENSVIELGLNEEIITIYQRIIELIECKKVGYKELISSLIFQLIAQINAIKRSKNFGGREFEMTINKSKIIMADRIGKKISFTKLAKELNVGYLWFRKMFRLDTGLTPAQYFLELKLNKAKDLLINTPLSIKEIAIITGFESQFYFSKFFKKRMGRSPINLRKYSRANNKIEK